MTPSGRRAITGPAGETPDKHGPRTRSPAAGRTPLKKPVLEIMQPGCILINGQGSCPEWEMLLQDFPMIDSVQREDIPGHNSGLAYLAHFYRTGDHGKEKASARKEFRKFFRAIGYRYESSGDYEGRWFEGIGIRRGA